MNKLLVIFIGLTYLSNASLYTCKVNGENIGITIDGKKKIRMVDENGILRIGYLNGQEYNFGHGAGSVKITKDKKGNVVSILIDDNVNTYTSMSCSSNPQYDKYYIDGDKIAEGVSLSMVTGMAVADPKLTYLTTTVHDTLTNNNTWPLIEVTTKIYSKIIGDIIITYYLLMEQGTNNIVGTVKMIKVNGNPKNSLIVMNNKMFIEDNIGTRQVQIINGEIQIID